MYATCDHDYYEVPARVVWQGAIPLVEMRRIRSDALGKAFWDDAYEDAPISGLRKLDDLPLPPGPRPLSGSIFHTYRCGSTLVCRQLSALPSVYAIAEPSFLYQLVLGYEQETHLLRDRIVKLLALLAEGLGARGRQIVVKWPGLRADRAAVLTAAFPDVPAIFLHRDPVEVLSSIAQRPLGNAKGAPAALGLALPPGQITPVERAAIVIAHLCKQVAQVPSIRHCDYRNLDAVRLARHFGLDTGEAAQAAMAEASQWYSKGPAGRKKFVSDSAQKQAFASDEVHRCARDILAPALAETIGALREL